jgi:hypothetical protein
VLLVSDESLNIFTNVRIKRIRVSSTRSLLAQSEMVERLMLIEPQDFFEIADSEDSGDNATLVSLGEPPDKEPPKDKGSVPQVGPSTKRTDTTIPSGKKSDDIVNKIRDVGSSVTTAKAVIESDITKKEESETISTPSQKEKEKVGLSDQSNPPLKPGTTALGEPDDSEEANPSDDVEPNETRPPKPTCESPSDDNDEVKKDEVKKEEDEDDKEKKKKKKKKKGNADESDTSDTEG